MDTAALLRKYFDKKKKSSPGFSMRVLATRLDISPSFLSRVFAGKKAVPFPLLVRLAELLEIEPEMYEGLRDAHIVPVGGGKAPKKGKAQLETELEDWELVGKEAFKVLRQWFYLPILEATKLKDFDGSLDFLSKRLGLTKAVTEIAVRELLSLGLLEETAQGLRKTGRRIRWASGKPSPEIRRFHAQMMERACQELEKATAEKDLERRLITGITVTAPAEAVGPTKAKIAEFIHGLANELGESGGSEVYQLSVQFFPLTRR